MRQKLEVCVTVKELKVNVDKSYKEMQLIECELLHDEE
jgi:hypothetical protein